MESPLRDIAAIWRRLTTRLRELLGWEPSHRIELSNGLSLKITERWVELQADGEGPQYRLTREDAAFFVRQALNALAAQERREIAVSLDLYAAVDARTERIPETLFQKLAYRFIRPEQVILSLGRGTFTYRATLDRTGVEARLKEADAILGSARPAAS